MTDVMGGFLHSGGRFSPCCAGGAGYTENDNDAIGKAVGFVEKDKTAAYYIQAAVTLAPGVFVVPEIGYWDLFDDIAGNDEGDFWYAGAKWQIDF